MITQLETVQHGDKFQWYHQGSRYENWWVVFSLVSAFTFYCTCNQTIQQYNYCKNSNALPSNLVVKTEINNILLTMRKNSIWSFSQSDDQSSLRVITWEDRFKTNTLKCWVKSYHLKALKRIMYSVTNFNLKSKALTCRSQCTVDITMGTSSLLASKSRNEVDKLKASLN